MNEPTITREQAVEAMRALLGDDLAGVREVRVNLTEVTVIRRLEDDHGNALVFNDALAYQEQTIRIARPRPTRAQQERILRAEVADAFDSLAEVVKPGGSR